MNSISLNYHGTVIQQQLYPQQNVKKNHQNNLTHQSGKWHNCGSMAQYLRSCKEPWCSNCQQSWSNITDTPYHHMSQCPRFVTIRPTPHQHYIPRPTRPTFPPRGTAPRQMQSNTTTYSQFNNTGNIDYNDIQSLRAYAIRTYDHGQTSLCKMLQL